MIHALILTAAGNSSRMGGPVKKEYLPFGAEPGISVLSAALYPFFRTNLFSRIVLTVPENGEDDARDALALDTRMPPLPWESNDLPCLCFAEGGRTRQASVLSGLDTLERTARQDGVYPDIVLIHDAARPWVSEAVITAVIGAVTAHGAAVPGVTPVDTQKEIDAEGRIIRHLTRARLAAMQTPQGFRFKDLLDAHRKAAEDGREYTDDAEIWGRYVGDVYVSPGDPANRKITYPDDIK